MDRLLNYLFLFIVVCVFALWAPVETQSALVVGLIISFLFCSATFLMGWLTYDGAASAIVLGTLTFGIGKGPMTIVLISFFASSVLISRKHQQEEPESSKKLEVVHRDGLQVWANGFWMAFWLIAGILTGFFVCWLAAVAAIATATADTWATELGSQRFKSTTYLLNTLQPVEAGTQGGVSWPGLAAALGGSLFISTVAACTYAIGAGWFFAILGSGFAGAVFDSYAGATWQINRKTVVLPGIQGHHKKIIIDNNMVNWLATGAGSIILLILNLLFI